MELTFLRKLHYLPLWLHKSWKRTVPVALEIQKIKRKKEREKRQMLKLSIKLVQAFPWHFFPGGNESPIISVCMGTHCQSCCGQGGGPSLAPSPGTEMWSQKLQLPLLLDLTRSVLGVQESSCQTHLAQGLAEEGLDNLANWVSAELITGQRLE